MLGPLGTRERCHGSHAADGWKGPQVNNTPPSDTGGFMPVAHGYEGNVAAMPAPRGDFDMALTYDQLV